MRAQHQSLAKHNGDPAGFHHICKLKYSASGEWKPDHPLATVNTEPGHSDSQGLSMARATVITEPGHSDSQGLSVACAGLGWPGIP